MNFNIFMYFMCNVYIYIYPIHVLDDSNILKIRHFYSVGKLNWQLQPAPCFWVGNMNTHSSLHRSLCSPDRISLIYLTLTNLKQFLGYISIPLKFSPTYEQSTKPFIQTKKRTQFILRTSGFSTNNPMEKSSKSHQAHQSPSNHL